MWFVLLLLAGAVLGAGAIAGTLPEPLTRRWLKPMLAFSGAYLFTLTLTHLLPEALLLLPGSPRQVGYWALAGFFGQIVLEAFSQGIEHGHIHHEQADSGRVPLALLLALVLHALLEGSILVPGQADNLYAVALGVALHHVPAAVALALLLRVRLGSFKRIWPWLSVFALASPAGLLLSNYVLLPQLLGGGVYAALLGFVAGNFLHVSTTILFETSPDHQHFNWPKLAATLAGLALALGISG